MSGLRDYKAVAKACNSSEVRVRAAAPLIYDALHEQGILTTRTAIAALGTAAVECRFKPVIESYWLKPAAWTRWADGTRYGKADPVTGHRYIGRGLIQLTWRGNYEKYGRLLGVDLLNHPERALEPRTAARVLALYFRERKVREAADAGDWRAVRKLVNGGFNGWSSFKECVDRLLVVEGGAAAGARPRQRSLRRRGGKRRGPVDREPGAAPTGVSG